MATIDSIDLGSSASFALLAPTSITCTGTCNISGNVGVNVLSAPISQFPPSIITNGCIVSATVSQTAMTDVNAVYAQIASRASASVLPAEIGGLTFAPGLYHSAGAVTMATGNMTFSGAGVYVFQVDAACAIAATLSTVLTNDATPENIFWQIGGAFALGAGVSFHGTVLCNGAIAIGAGSSVLGRLLTMSGALTMDSSNVTVPFSAAQNAQQALNERFKLVATTNTIQTISIRFPDGRLRVVDVSFGVSMAALVKSVITADPQSVCNDSLIKWKLQTPAGLDASFGDVQDNAEFLLMPHYVDWGAIASSGCSVTFKTSRDTLTIPVNPAYTVSFYMSQFSSALKLTTAQNQIWIDATSNFITPAASMQTLLKTGPIKIVLCDAATVEKIQMPTP
jgi:hypothetical protein